MDDLKTLILTMLLIPIIGIVLLLQKINSDNTVIASNTAFEPICIENVEYWKNYSQNMLAVRYNKDGNVVLCQSDQIVPK